MKKTLKDKFKRFAAYWAPVYLFMALIFIISSLSHPPEPKIELEGIDKVYHIIEYGILGYLLFRAFRSSENEKARSNAPAFAIIISAVFALSDEIHQAFVPFREADIYDFLADLAGAIIMNIRNLRK